MTTINVITGIGCIFFLAMWLWSLRTIDQLEQLAFRAEAIFKNCTVEFGYCCCGDDMEGHDGAMHCGHTPVDQGAYSADKWREDFRLYTGAAPELPELPGNLR